MAFTGSMGNVLAGSEVNPCERLAEDISGPAVTAWRLHQRWESSRLVIIEDEGHGGPASMAALTQAVEQITALA